MKDRNSKEIATINNIFDDFFINGKQNKGMIRKTVISGSKNRTRSTLAIRLAEKVRGSGYPVVFVHRSNPLLVERYGTGIIENEHRQYALDLFENLDKSEIASVLYEVGKSTADLTIEAKTIIAIGLDALEADGQKLDMQNLCNFPWEMVSAFIFKSNKINSNDKLTLIQRLAPFSMQIPAVAALFGELKIHVNSQRANMRLPAKSLSEALNMQSAVVAVDIGTDTNDIYAETIFALLKLHKEKQCSFLSVIDSIPASSENSIAFKLYRSTDVKTPVMIVSPDLAQSYAGKLGMFNDIVGSGANIVVLAHTSGYSADVWSTYFGEYYAQREEVASGRSRENYRFFSSTSSSTVTRSEERRRVIPPEEIIMLNKADAIMQCGYIESECYGWRFKKVDLHCLGD